MLCSCYFEVDCFEDEPGLCEQFSLGYGTEIETNTVHLIEPVRGLSSWKTKKDGIDVRKHERKTAGCI